MLAIVALTGCGAKGSKFSNFTQELNKDEAAVYIYRPSRILGAAIRHGVWKRENDELVAIGSLRNGGYLYTTIKAGETTDFYTRLNKTITNKLRSPIFAEAGELYCIRMGITLDRPTLKLVDLETCKQEIKDTRYSK